HRFEWLLGAFLAALFVTFWIWQTPGNLRKLSSVEVDAYLHRMEGKLPGEPAEQAVFLARMRAFGLADDGRPVYVLNPMRYSPEPRVLRAVERSAVAQGRALQARGARDRAGSRVCTGDYSGPSLDHGRGLPDRVPRGGLAARCAQKAELSVLLSINHDGVQG